MQEATGSNASMRAGGPPLGMDRDRRLFRRTAKGRTQASNASICGILRAQLVHRRGQFIAAASASRTWVAPADELADSALFSQSAGVEWCTTRCSTESDHNVAAVGSRPQFPVTMPTNIRWPTSRSEGTGSLLPDLVRPLATGGQVDAYTLTSQLAGAATASALLWIVLRGCGLSRVSRPDLGEGSCHAALDSPQ